MAIDYDKYAERVKSVAGRKPDHRAPIDDAVLGKIKEGKDAFTMERGAKAYNQKLQVSQKYGITPPPEPTAERVEKWGEETMHAKPFEAAGDLVKGVFTRALPGTAASVATVVDDPYKSGGVFDKWIDSNKKAQEEYINAPGADDIAIPFTTITRREMREGITSLGFSAAAWISARLGGAAAGAVAGTASGVPLAGTATGAVIGFVGGAAAAGAMAYKMDKNAFVRNYRAFLEQKEGRKITDEEFAQYRSGKVADLIAEHGYHEAGWEGIFTAIEQGTLARLGGGLPSKALKGLLSLALFELGSEAGTQIGQSNVEVKLGMSDEEDLRSYLSPQDWLTSMREVLPAILVMSGVTTTVETGVGAVADKIHTGRVEELRSQGLSIQELNALAEDPAAMESMGVVQDDVVSVMKEQVKVDVENELRERGYTPEELDEIAKDKEFIDATGADIEIIKKEVTDEIEVAKNAENVDPLQEDLKKLNNKIANLEKLPGADKNIIEEAVQQRDALVAQGVQEPEGLSRADNVVEAVKRRENLIALPDRDEGAVRAAQDDIETYLSRIATGQSKPDESTVLAVDAVISNPEMIEPENKEIVLGFALSAAKKIGRDTKDIEALMSPPTQGEADSKEEAGLTPERVAAVEKNLDDKRRRWIDEERKTNPNFAPDIESAKELLSPEQLKEVERYEELRYKSTAMQGKEAGYKPYKLTKKEIAERDALGKKYRSLYYNTPTPQAIIQSAGGLKAMLGMKKEAQELRGRLKQVLGTKNADHATVTKALMEHAGVKTQAQLNEWALTKPAKSGMKESRVDVVQSLYDNAAQRGHAPEAIDKMLDIIAIGKLGGTKPTRALVNEQRKKITNDDIWEFRRRYDNNKIKKVPDNVKELVEKNRDIFGVPETATRKPDDKVLSDNVERRRQAVVDYMVSEGVLPDDTDTGPSNIFNIRMGLSKREGAIQQFARQFGIDVLFYTSTSKSLNFLNGFYHPNIPNTVFIRREATNPELHVLGHEFAHSLENNHPETYAALKAAILNGSFKKGVLPTKLFNYAKKLKKLDPSIEGEGIKDEYVADFIGELFLEKDFIDIVSFGIQKNIGDFANMRAVIETVTSVLKRMLDKAASFLNSRKSVIKDSGFDKAKIDNIKTMLADKIKSINKEEQKKTNQNLSNIEKGDGKFQFQRTDRDAEYLELAKDPEKNKERLQEMVDEAAREAGYNEEAWHGTGAEEDFTVFENRTPKSGRIMGRGFYFSENEDDARQWGENVYAGGVRVIHAALSIKNPLRLDTDLYYGNALDGIQGSDFAKWMVKKYKHYMPDSISDYLVGKTDSIEEFEADDFIHNRLSDFAEEYGYDGVVGYYYDETHYMVFNPDQIKSADPVTYDDQGNVIPLSERFNEQSDDIRFKKGAAATGTTAAQVEAWLSPAMKKLAGAPDVAYVQSESELSDRIKAAIKKQNASGDVVAVIDRGKIWFVADNITDEKAATSAMLHEVFGHHGVEAVLGKEKSLDFFKSVLEDRQDTAAFRGIVGRYKLDMTTTEDQMTAAREYVARLAESGVDDSLLTRVIGMVRDALRKMGFKMELTDTDIRHLIAQGARRMTTTAPIALTPMYSQKAGKWYSEMESVLADKLPGKGTGGSYAQTIQSWAKKGMIKAEELEWSGLLDWLNEQGKVTKTDVLDWLAENNVRVEEVVKSGSDIVDVEAWWNDEGGANEDTPFNDLSEQEQREAASRYQEEVGDYDEDGTKFGPDTHPTLNVPGGENYKELLITLPGGEYSASHFSEKGILAHVRFNERTGPNGERVLFIEEVQSDWHQEGRRKGYGSERESKQGWTAEETDMQGDFAVYDEDGRYIHTIAALDAQDAIDHTNAIEKEGVPNAPFKKTWPLLAMKRMVRYAAENGFDTIAWTPGEVQADRYDLSKQVDEIGYLKTEKGNYVLNIYKDNKNISQPLGIPHTVAPDKLEAYVGKEIAEKIIKGKPTGTFSGLDLKVGGEGMKGFYDKILPAEVNKFFGKAKWGKARVGEMEIFTSEGSDREIKVAWGDEERIIGDALTVHSLPITPEMKSKAMSEGMPLFQRKADKQPQPAPRSVRPPTKEEVKAVSEQVYQAPDEQKKSLEDVRARGASFLETQWKAMAAAMKRNPQVPASTIAAPDVKRGVLGLLNTLLPPVAHAKKFQASRDAIDAAQKGQSLQHLMNIRAGTALKAFYELDKKQKQEAIDLLLEEDAGGFEHDYQDLPRPKELGGRGISPAAALGAAAVRDILNERLKEQTRGTLPNKLAILERERSEAADIIHSATTRKDLKNKLTAWAKEKSIELNDGEFEHISFIYDHVQMNRGYVPHKWKHPWRVMFTSKNAKGEQITTIKSFPMPVNTIIPREAMRSAAAVAAAGDIMKKEFGWTDEQVKAAKDRSDKVKALIEQKREALDNKERDRAKGLQEEINEILDKQETFRVIHSREMPTDFFEGARPEQMQAIISTSIGNALERMSQKDRDVTGMAEELDAQVKMEMEMLYLKKGGMKSLLKRKNIQGFRTDIDDVIAEYLAETASAIVKRDMGRDFSKILSGINAAEQPALWQEIKDYAKDVLSPTPEATAFKMTAGVMYLGADLSAVILNMTQNFTHGVGTLWAIPGKGNPVKQITDASMDIFKVWNTTRAARKQDPELDLFPEEGIEGVITPEEVAVLRRMKDEGKLDPQLLGEQTGFKVNQISENRVVMAAMFKLFGAAEGMNRLSLALAAVRRATAAGKTYDEAMDMAVKAVEKAHFLYGRSNRPKLVRSLDRATGKLALGSMGYTFMTYPVMNIVYIRDYMWDLFEGIYKGDKVQAQNAMKMAGSQFAATMLFGGMTALPFYGLAQAVAALFGGDDDEDWETIVRKSLKGPAGVGLTRGLPAATGLFDMSRSVEGTDVFQTPVGIQVLQQMKKRLGQSWDMALHEEYGSAAFHLTPDFIRNPYRAWLGLEKGGEYRYAPPIKYTAREAATRAVGMTPPRESEAYRRAQATLQMQEKRSKKIRDLARRFMVDRREAPKIRKEISEYNKQALKKRLPRIVWNDIINSASRQTKSRTENMTDRPAKKMENYRKGL